MQIRNCDGILSNMEQLLGRFQSDLGRVSEEIRQLQVGVSQGRGLDLDPLWDLPPPDWIRKLQTGVFGGATALGPMCNISRSRSHVESPASPPYPAQIPLPTSPHSSSLAEWLCRARASDVGAS